MQWLEARRLFTAIRLKFSRVFRLNLSGLKSKIRINLLHELHLLGADGLP
ncbi:hypothetical protein CSUNSWCD_672 [Campylobacter showae CSUNSWCD]|uniref:Uncharacterized protein n=1 Tax=Campylobacter showae CSUNSWCD TaxID=1244083 RepID=M5IQJ3_9BACT|nr:hypothetical protein CSUNSWCD_672 [Campylobacter showae CSUNSWCD]